MLRSPRSWLLTAPLLVATACGSDEAPLGDGGGLAVPDGGTFDGGPLPTDAGPGPMDGGFVTVGEIQISRTEVDFGPVVVTSTATETLTLTNPQPNAVRVSLSAPSGPDADAFELEVSVPREGASFVLEPGATADVTLTLTPSEVRPYLATLALDSCAGECPTSIVVQAEGVETAVVCPEMADLGVVNPGQCASQTVTCENQGQASERVSAVTLTDEGAFTITAPSLPADLSGGDAFAIDVEFCPTELATVSTELIVETDRPSAVARRVGLTGRGGGPDVECTPLTLDFGAAGVGSSFVRNVSCENRGDEPLELVGALAAGQPFSITDAPAAAVEAGARGIFAVEFAPTALGLAQDTLQIATNDPDTPEVTVSLQGEAVDLLPCAIDAQPASIDFGLVAQQDRRTAEFALTNVGVTECQVTGFTTTAQPGDPLSVLAMSSAAALAPGDALRIPVRFAPTLPGAATASITVSFGNPMSPDLSLSVRGEGGAPEIAVSPDPVAFGGVAVGCAAPATRTVTIRRTAPGFGAITNVQLVTSATAAFSLSVGNLPQNLGFFDTLGVDVTFTPPAVGAFAAELRISSSGQPDVVVPVTGVGQAATSRTDTVNLTRPPVDVLFVVDDSCSMDEAQVALGATVPAFVNAFSSRGVDFQVGVVTTDMTDNARSGRLQGTPPFLTSTSMNLLSQLSARMQPGTGGSGTEQGIRASLTAVTPPLANTSNAGFLRPNADLAIVYLTDENDVSQGGFTTADYLNGLRGAAGAGSLFLASISGPATNGCTGPYGGAQAAPDYHALVTAAGGLTLSYCDDMLQNLLAVSGAIFGADEVTLSGTPLITTLAVRVNGAAVPRLAVNGDVNWAYDLSTNRVVFLDPSVVPTGATIDVTYDAFCLSATCGDGTTDPNEQCDDMNASNADACINCVDAVCGDGFTQAGVEECDDGNLVQTDGCTTQCLAPACGDGFLQAGEECDDGNTVGGDGCPATCVFYGTTGLQSFVYTPIANATALSFAGDNDDGVADIALPFAFPYFDAPTATVSVSVNGFVAFTPFNPADSAANLDIPNAASPNGIVAAWWEDLLLDTQIPGGAEISWVVQGAAPNRTVIIQWRDVRVENQTTRNHRRFNFQIHLSENGNIRLAYGDTETRNRVPTATSASAGLEDATGTRGYEALDCSPTCVGPPRAGFRPNGFPEQSTVLYNP